jgi:hypothetical protein
MIKIGQNFIDYFNYSLPDSTSKRWSVYCLFRNRTSNCWEVPHKAELVRLHPSIDSQSWPPFSSTLMSVSRPSFQRHLSCIFKIKIYIFSQRNQFKTLTFHSRTSWHKWQLLDIDLAFSIISMQPMHNLFAKAQHSLHWNRSFARMWKLSELWRPIGTWNH